MGFFGKKSADTGSTGSTPRGGAARPLPAAAAAPSSRDAGGGGAKPAQSQGSGVPQLPTAPGARAPAASAAPASGKQEQQRGPEAATPALTSKQQQQQQQGIQPEAQFSAPQAPKGGPAGRTSQPQQQPRQQQQQQQRPVMPPKTAAARAEDPDQASSRDESFNEAVLQASHHMQRVAQHAMKRAGSAADAIAAATAEREDPPQRFTPPASQRTPPAAAAHTDPSLSPQLSGGSGSGSKEKSMPALFAVQDFYKGKTPQQLAASIPVDTSNPAAAVKQLQQQLALEKQAREELEDLLVRLDGHVQREAAGRAEAERKLAELMTAEARLQLQLGQTEVAQNQHQQHLVQERQALDQALKECAAQLAVARSELARAQQAAANEAASIRQQEAAERQRLVATYEVMLANATEQAEKSKADMMMQAAAMQQELARWRKQAQGAAEAVLSAKAEVRQRRKELGDVQERMDQLVDQLYAGRDNTVGMRDAMALAQRYSALLSGQFQLQQLEAPKAATSKLYLQPPFVPANMAGGPSPGNRPLLPSSRTTTAAPSPLPPPVFSRNTAPQPLLNALVEEINSPGSTLTKQQLGTVLGSSLRGTGAASPTPAAAAAAAAAASRMVAAKGGGEPAASEGWNSTTKPDPKKKAVTISSPHGTLKAGSIAAGAAATRGRAPAAGSSTSYASAVASRNKTSRQPAAAAAGAGATMSSSRRGHPGLVAARPPPLQPPPSQGQRSGVSTGRSTGSPGVKGSLSAGSLPTSHIPKLPAVGISNGAAGHGAGHPVSPGGSLLRFNTASKLPVLSQVSSMHSSMREPGSLVFSSSPGSPLVPSSTKSSNKQAPARSRMG